MADVPLRMQNYPSTYYGRRTDWGAIWGGVFTFAAIWSVFEALGMAIFASAAPANAPVSVWSMNAGMAIWTIVLTIIAMYVAGLETGRLAGVATRHDGLIHGIIMFGLSVVSVIIISSLTNAATTGLNTTTHVYYPANLMSDVGWAGFAALFLGWLAAMGGASSGVQRRAAEVREPIQMRPAA
jgi:hypothetical protein